ncbi:hypothetical protein DXA97_14545 [Clostridium sp. OF09-36]|uniref:hypothetical protein n=1 Tax=Clostridium sp. OF09-36 TaxID=2292310 RepID=UPI000E50170E|nr:hypothetical protein [Clostridium sp. OF09-36]RHV85955.1 hypothetical protein DXA97_14545 [Clostridium sp. OF09-36]
MERETDFSKYENMLYLKRPVSRNHPPMDLKDRAAQFSPFAALTGYGDAVKETERQTEQRRELDEYEKAALDEQLRELEAQLQNLENGKNQAAPRVTVTCFIPDEYKAGGAYRTFTAAVKKIDHDRRGIILQNGTQEGECVLLDDILKLDIHMDFDSRI